MKYRTGLSKSTYLFGKRVQAGGFDAAALRVSIGAGIDKESSSFPARADDGMPKQLIMGFDAKQRMD